MVGLGRNFAWNQWARVNNVVAEDFSVRRTDADRARFMQLSDSMRDADNALDSRSHDVPAAQQLELTWA